MESFNPQELPPKKTQLENIEESIQNLQELLQKEGLTEEEIESLVNGTKTLDFLFVKPLFKEKEIERLVRELQYQTLRKSSLEKDDLGKKED